MLKKEIISLFITLILVLIIAIIFIILYRKYISKEIIRINSGTYDLDLTYDILKSKEKKQNKTLKIIKQVILIIISIILIQFVVRLGISKIKNEPFMIFNKSVIAVASGSMSYKHEDNDYLIENNLNDQFQAFDIIVVDKVNYHSELKLYDVISFKHDGINIIHRIIKINKDGTFKTQGDANNSADNFDVSFEDIVGVYHGTRVKKIGIFILFLQSYAGIATCLLLFSCLFVIDYYSNKINDASVKRTKLLKTSISSNETIENTNEVINILFYNDYQYYFSNEKYLGKDIIKDKLTAQKSKNKIIKKQNRKGD